jgi:small subunit ribosomal protein S7
MMSCKKSTAFTVFYDAMDTIAEKTGEDPHGVWKKALNNVMPQVEVRSKRIGGATFQIPIEIRAERKIFMGMKWIIKFSRARSGKGIANKLAAELMAGAKNEGAAVKRKEDTHKMAESNRAFAHFRV